MLIHTVLLAIACCPGCWGRFLRWADGSAAQRPQLLVDLALSILEPRLPWATPMDPPLELTRSWERATELNGTVQRRLRTSLHNAGDVDVHVDSVTVLRIPHRLSPDTALYGEGFQMLSQTEGTIQDPRDLSQFTDRGHYRLMVPEDAVDVFSLLHLNAMSTAADGGDGLNDHLVMSFVSSFRFVGKFLVNEEVILAVLDMDSLVLSPGETVDLEDLLFFHARDAAAHSSMRTRDELFQMAGAALRQAHVVKGGPPDISPARVTGWCSWYAHGAHLTAENVRAAARHMKILREDAGIPLQYLQIDDGYQQHMGDWLDPSQSLGIPLEELLQELVAQGTEIALWVAPFVASHDSRLLAQHPDWFVGDAVSGSPLRSDEVTFGGWRQVRQTRRPGTHSTAAIHQYSRTLRLFSTTSTPNGTSTTSSSTLSSGAHYLGPVTRLPPAALGGLEGAPKSRGTGSGWRQCDAAHRAHTSWVLIIPYGRRLGCSRPHVCLVTCSAMSACSVPSAERPCYEGGSTVCSGTGTLTWPCSPKVSAARSRLPRRSSPRRFAWPLAV